jgi:intracellular sulfur oxidation DsrE/DsrF family protein
LEKIMKYPLLLGLVAFGFAVSLGFGDEPKTAKTMGEKTMLKAVIHVNFADSDRQKHGLKNVSNILKEVKGEAEIVVVCHGAGIDLLVKEKSQLGDEVARLIKEKVRFVACENTLRDKSIPKDKLLPGVTTTPSGAVEVIRKQQEGFGYFKP